MADNFTIKQLDEFHQAFAMYDQEACGLISTGELRALFAQLGQPISRREMKDYLETYDETNTGLINFPTFLKILVERLKNSTEDEEQRNAFKVFDVDGSGMIDSEELRMTMQNFGERLTQEEVNEMIRTADLDGDGKINYQEFIQMLKPTVIMK